MCENIFIFSKISMSNVKINFIIIYVSMFAEQSHVHFFKIYNLNDPKL